MYHFSGYGGRIAEWLGQDKLVLSFNSDKSGQLIGEKSESALTRVTIIFFFSNIKEGMEKMHALVNDYRKTIA